MLMWENEEEHARTSCSLGLSKMFRKSQRVQPGIFARVLRKFQRGNEIEPKLECSSNECCPVSPVSVVPSTSDESSQVFSDKSVEEVSGGFSSSLVSQGFSSGNQQFGLEEFNKSSTGFSDQLFSFGERSSNQQIGFLETPKLKMSDAEFVSRIGTDSIWKERFKSLSFDGGQEYLGTLEVRNRGSVISLWERRMLVPIPEIEIPCNFDI